MTPDFFAGQDDTIRQGILDDLLDAVIGVPEIRGVVDDYPPENLAEPPPRPRLGYGEPALPFAYVVDGQERVLGTETFDLYECQLPIEIAVLYRYDPSDGAAGCKRVGRQLLGRVQRGVMQDPNRGGRAYRTLEDDNDTGEAVASEQLGIAVWRGRVDYARAAKDPATRGG